MPLSARDQEGSTPRIRAGESLVARDLRRASRRRGPPL